MVIETEDRKRRASDELELESVPAAKKAKVEEEVAAAPEEVEDEYVIEGTSNSNSYFVLCFYEL